MSQPNRPKRRSDAQPQIVSDQRRQQLGTSFAEQSADQALEYDAVRPRYPDQAVLDILALADRSYRVGGTDVEGAPETGAAGVESGGPLGGARLTTVVDLGAGTGILTRQLLDCGARVIAVEPSPPMLDALLNTSEEMLGPRSAGGTRKARTGARSRAQATVEARCAPAEQTGLPDGCADIVVAAQSWHWFDPEATQSEAARLLDGTGALALIWNYLDTADPTVHRLTRIMRAGDVYRPDWQPTLDPALYSPVQSAEYRWKRILTVTELFRYATTLSSWLSAGTGERAARRANLADYLHGELGLAEDDAVELPQITALHTAWVRPG
ncbi:class I SAM-dependent methyltransferase [Nesterenkonia ebinurensis]|uniref:class I SAM-dependent methyltransferase n=1 Tax=Nesterenkonia ebinurensis TaxID=2608252 RepID=UPI00123DBCA1|nr:class I SAM-dependent methyltransferase [Nesterenkonia ebinurensis]